MKHGLHRQRADRGRTGSLLGRLAQAACGLLLVAGLSACSLFTSLPEPTTLRERLDMLPQQGLALAEPVTIRWNEHQVPYIFARSDSDAAYAIGIVHAHLRLGQMEFARRLAQGRLAEIAGPTMVEIDQGLRALGLYRGTRETVALMPARTRQWVERYVEGINDFLARTKDEDLPHEFQAFALEKEPWTPQDVVAVGKLAGIDVTWLDWLQIFDQRRTQSWGEVLADSLRHAFDGPVSFETSLSGDDGSDATGGGASDTPTADEEAFAPHGANAAGRRLAALLTSQRRGGSNSLVVGGARSASGAGMIASDPHLSLLLPNLWLIAGLKTPEREVVGFMGPGLPVFGLGRNRAIAWGGTSLHAASSDLVDVSALDTSTMALEDHRIGVRAWFDEVFTHRMSDYGPVISDVPLIRNALGLSEDDQLALRWIGYEPSDEFTAFLDLQTATDFTEFRAAFEGFSHPGQNFMYADVEGNIGQIIAARLPQRPVAAPTDLVVSPEESDMAWSAFDNAVTLPAGYNPEQAFLASSNNRPTVTDVLVGYFYAPADRFLRLSDLLGADEAVTVEDLRQIQRDVFSRAAADLLAALRTRVPVAALTPEQRATWRLIEDWDGTYGEGSRAALAFESFTLSIWEGLYPGLDNLPKDPRAANRFRKMLRQKLSDLSDETMLRLVPPALDTARAHIAEHGAWGDVHRLVLRYPAADIPIVGSVFPQVEAPGRGSSETVMKSAHGVRTDKHAATYGAQARHISDMSNPDANYFVLAGGQDGWLNSSTFADQANLWMEGRYIRMPLTDDLIMDEFPYVTTLEPRR